MFDNDRQMKAYFTFPRSQPDFRQSLSRCGEITIAIGDISELWRFARICNFVFLFILRREGNAKCEILIHVEGERGGSTTFLGATATEVPTPASEPEDLVLRVDDGADVVGVDMLVLADVEDALAFFFPLLFAMLDSWTCTRNVCLSRILG